MKIKICGLTTPKEAEYLNRNQVDFAGMVLFYPKSKRNISLEQAWAIQQALNPEIQTVAVVVSPTMEQVQQIEAAGFHYVQIHGKLPEGLFSHTTIPVLKAFNIKDIEQYSYYHSCANIAGYVFDAQEPGSGKTFDWSLVKQLPKDEKLFLLAGGLTPDNVQTAIAYLHPDGVDVSSGVEYLDRPGKDPVKIKTFVSNARNASIQNNL